MGLKNMFDAKQFDSDFYHCETGTKGKHKRDVNHDVYLWFSERLTDAFKDTDCKSVLDIGAGLGIRTTNHIANGFDAYPCDVSQYGHDHSVLPDKHYLADVRDLSKVDRTFDIVIAERVLGYIPPKDSLKALKQIDSKADKYIVFSIICSDHKDRNIVEIAKPLRKNIQPQQFWLDLFAKFNWHFDEDKTNTFLKDDWSCIWVYKKR